MKKLFTLLTTAVLTLSLAACGSTEAKTELTVYFVPSRDSAEILEATEPLKELLKTELNNQGYEFETVNIEVGSTYEAVGEALGAGTADVGLIPGGTYVLYAEDGIDVALTATRYALSVDSDDAAPWNTGNPTEDDMSAMATFYRGLIIAGPSAKGAELAAKVEAGEALTWEDMNSASWCVRSSSSSSGYIYPTIWLGDNFDGKTIADLENVTTTDGYGATFNALAAETCDLGTIYGDARMHNASKWDSSEEGGFGREASIWDEVKVVGVTAPIYNDTVSVSTKTVDADLKAAIQTAFINVAKTEAGAEAVSIYSHKGYQVAEDADYDNERKAQDLIKSMN
jgi:phosphonate transport system substrate-binding protein